MITIGIDPHKLTLTAVGLAPDGRALASVRLAVDAATLEELLVFAQAWPDRRWAVEGATGLGLGIAQRLLACGEDVVDVPATLAARARLLSTGHGRKTDVHDAAAVALVAQHHRKLRHVQPEDPSSVIRLVSDHRDDLVHEHTAGLNRLHWLLRELIPGGAPTGTSSRQAAVLLGKVRPVTATDTARKQLARDLIVGLRALEARIKALTDQLAVLVAQSGSSLAEISGVGSVVAAKIIGHTGGNGSLDWPHCGGLIWPHLGDDTPLWRFDLAPPACGWTVGFVVFHEAGGRPRGEVQGGAVRGDPARPST